jgi:hypothetical protein
MRTAFVVCREVVRQIDGLIILGHGERQPDPREVTRCELDASDAVRRQQRGD